MSVTEAAAVWEEERRVSRYAAELPQLSSEGKRISPNPKDWRCEETGATDNLWLNLSTGFIGSGRQVRTDVFGGACLGARGGWGTACGRSDQPAGTVCARRPRRCAQNWDGTGGNGSALRHFEATGRKYPLVVKLGTITPHGADVYS